MKNLGYIKLFRAIEDWEWIDDYIMFYFWGRILLMANWEDKQWHGETIERGSFVTTLAGLSKHLKLSIKQVRTCISRLQKGKQIVVDGAQKRTKITICKYDDYQGIGANEGQEKGTIEGTQRAQTKEGSEYSDSNESSYSSQEDKNILNNSQDAPAYTYTPPREQSPHPPAPFPYPTPFRLSSTERDWAMNTPEKIVQLKRAHLEENLKTFELEIGMDEAERRKFLDYYCQRGDRNPSEILAERSGYFDLRYRATKWMEDKKPKQEQPKSRVEQYADTSKKFHALMDELYGTSDNGTENGAPDYPDEQ